MRHVAVAAILLIATAAHAAPPTNCTFPNPVDVLAAVKPGQVITSALYNQLQCIIARLMSRSSATPRGDVICRANVAVGKGERVAVTLATTTALVGNEMVLANVLDTMAPQRLTADGWSLASGNAVTVHVWNHDPDTDRSGTLCIHVIRP